MNKLSPIQWRRLLCEFAADNELRPALSLPFEQGEYIFSTDTHVIIRVNKSLVDKGDYDYSPKRKVPDASAVFPAHAPSFSISSEELGKAFAKLGIDPDDTTVKCPECGGSGEVDWEYTDHDGDTHIMVADCPCCDGDAYIPNGADSYCLINGKAILTNFMLKIHCTMRRLEVDALRCTHAHGTILFCLLPGIDVLAVTCPHNNTAKSAKIKTAKL